MEARILKIEDLVDYVQKEQFDLPKVQRGFVWKPSQIEDLWDSLLRGFPSGSIITSKVGEEKEMFQLLDGQQRTTSIALGFADLDCKEGCEVLRSSLADIRIFIDTRIPDFDKEGRHFAFRVITCSHPWGYQKLDNAKPIEANQKTKAMELWGENIDPFQDDILNIAFPYEAIAPLPLNIFTKVLLKNKLLNDIEKESKECEKELKEWLKKIRPDIQNPDITTWLFNLKKEKSPDISIDNSKIYSVYDIYKEIKKILEYKIPMLPLNHLLQDETDNQASSSNIDNENDNEDKDSDDVEEVFVRLNSSGTPLGGEELNYSIIKAKIDKDLQKEIEENCKGIMKPSRFITIAYRLCYNRTDEIFANLRIKPKQFQRDMKNSEEFQKFIKEIFETKLLDKIRSVLKINEGMKGYDDSKRDTDYRLPYPLFIKIAAAGQGEIIFTLMYWILEKRNLFEFEYGDKLHRQMIGIILIFMWLGKDDRSRYNKLLRSIWKDIKLFSPEQMWGNNIIQSAWEKENQEHEIKKQKNIPTDAVFIENIKESPRFNEFFDKVMRNRDLLLWIQRRFLSNENYFKEKLFRLDDTNVPFDWDHISPNNYVHNRRKIWNPLREIYQQPANFRAWPYRLNRGDGDKVPAVKLDDSNYLGYSFCDKEWLNFKKNWVENDWYPKIKPGKQKEVYKLLLNRWKAMYNELAKELCLKNLAKSAASP
ncbi:MAG: DUF262 domain-containing protein [Fibromonadales bacterium]|nr:DUF262 domain-containing protein [Fibromonadales bacterium]